MTRLILIFLSLTISTMATAAWEAKPIPSQVVGVDSPPTGTLHRAVLAFKDFRGLIKAELIMPPGIPNVGLYCGVAGQQGQELWNRGTGERDVVLLNSDDLNPILRTDACDVTINNIASLKEAARKRLLYVEYEVNGERRRGQLWPRSARLHREGGLRSWAHASPWQLPDPGPRDDSWWRGYNENMALAFSEERVTAQSPTPPGGGTLDWIEARSFSFRLYKYGIDTEITFHCAPPGEAGPVVASFPITGGRQYLRNSDIIPTSANSACGNGDQQHCFTARSSSQRQPLRPFQTLSGPQGAAWSVSGTVQRLINGNDVQQRWSMDTTSDFDAKDVARRRLNELKVIWSLHADSRRKMFNIQRVT